MNRYLIGASISVLLILTGVVLWFAHREAAALDREAAAKIEAIRARAKGEPVVIVEPGPVRVVEQERIVVQRIAPEAEPVLSAEVESGGETTGAPTIDCTEALKKAGGKSTSEEKNSSAEENLLVQCPNPLTGCETHITGWRTESGNVVATGTQTRWWQWAGKERQESTVDLAPANTKVTADPRLLVPDTSPRWIAGFALGLDGNADKRASVYGLRRIGVIRGRALYASAAGMVGGGDVVVTAGLAAGW